MLFTRACKKPMFSYNKTYILAKASAGFLVEWLLEVTRAPWGGSWALLASYPSSSLCLGRPRCLREVLGGHLWSRTSPRMVPPEALRQPKCIHLYTKTNDFRRAPVCRHWCPGVPLGPRKALQGPPRVPQRDPQGASWGPFSRAVP